MSLLRVNAEKTEIPAEYVAITIMRAEYPRDVMGVLESSGIHVE